MRGVANSVAQKNIYWTVLLTVLSCGHFEKWCVTEKGKINT